MRPTLSTATLAIAREAVSHAAAAKIKAIVGSVVEKKAHPKLSSLLVETTAALLAKQTQTAQAQCKMLLDFEDAEVITSNHYYMDIVQQLCSSEFGVNEPTIVYDSGEVRASRGCPAASSRLVRASRGCPAASSRLSASPRSSRVSSPGGHVGGHTKGEHREPCERAAHQEALAHGERRRFRVPPQALLAL